MNPTAFCRGYDAKLAGLGYNCNPYSEETEEANYNSWLNGWSYNDVRCQVA